MTETNARVAKHNHPEDKAGRAWANVVHQNRAENAERAEQGGAAPTGSSIGATGGAHEGRGARKRRAHNT